jgi:hypothetical protein
MKIIDQTLHLIDNAQDQAATVARDITKTAHATLVLVSVGVIAIIKDSVNGFQNPSNS